MRNRSRRAADGYEFFYFGDLSVGLDKLARQLHYLVIILAALIVQSHRAERKRMRINYFSVLFYGKFARSPAYIYNGSVTARKRAEQTCFGFRFAGKNIYFYPRFAL